ncbi:unnamed protein product [Albugo candida]|uniref:Mitochondrial carrier protein n=1 Tax=Albugo candida TaxID=65357 RepID=A0A024GRU4_9STRA|nr:unnamed protein product [Albugo candida]|eukprot:CCI49491.1 unnamed protein product [Albugo candida]
MPDAPSAIIDVVSGVTAGCAGVFVGQPFDTIKVRLQTHGTFYKGPIDCAKQTFKHEGIHGFFKGLSSPLIGSACTNAIVFSIYEKALKYLGTDEKHPSLDSVFIAGCLGGFCQTIAVTPTDLIKCRLQVQDGHQRNHYRGPIDCIRHVYQRNGSRGFYLGFNATILRETPSFGFYFYTYEKTKRAMVSHGFNDNTAMLCAGGLSGVGSWTLSYPLDVVKSSIQTLPIDATRKEKQMMYQVKSLYAKGGVRIFVRGLETAVLRAFPVNAVTFFCYEQSSQLMRDLLEK